MESGDERAAAECNLHCDVKTELSFTWSELGRDVKPRSDESFRIQSHERKLLSGFSDKSAMLSIARRAHIFPDHILKKL